MSLPPLPPPVVHGSGRFMKIEPPKQTSEQKDVLDQLILWRMRDPRYVDMNTRLKGVAMQRQWTIEARADFADKDKNEAITTAVQQAAVHIHAVMALLSDGQKPQVVAFSDDFFSGHAEIALHEDVIGNAIAAHGGTVEAAEVSDEMLAAVRELKK